MLNSMHASLILAAMIGSQAPPGPEPDAAVAKRILAATPRMRVAERSTASAVVVGRRKDDLYVLTADHAIDGPDTTILTFEFFEDGKPAFALKGAVAVLRRPTADFALLKVAVPADRNVGILKLAAPGKTAKRFPFEGFSAGGSRGDPPSREAETLLGKRLAVRRDEEMAFFWQAEKAQVRGRSGGPLLNGDGEVIGIGAATSLGKGYYVHLSEIHAALKAEHDWLWTADKGK